LDASFALAGRDHIFDIVIRQTISASL